MLGHGLLSSSMHNIKPWVYRAMDQIKARGLMAYELEFWVEGLIQFSQVISEAQDTTASRALAGQHIAVAGGTCQAAYAAQHA